jgi:hypothetical protein
LTDVTFLQGFFVIMKVIFGVNGRIVAKDGAISNFFASGAFK